MIEQLEQDIARGNRAQILLKDDLLNGAFDRLKAEYLKKWETANSRDVEGRERLWWAVRVVNEVRSDLANMVQNGTLARVELEQQDK